MTMLATSIRRLGASRLTFVGGIALFAAFTALTARITIPLPFTPVPITLQVMAALLAGLVLGSRGGAISQLAYLAAVAAGAPLDARGLGPAALLGPTAGYLLGFAPAAFLAGWLAERLHIIMGAWVSSFVAALAGVAVIYACGLAWLAPGVGSLGAAWALGAAPFILVDLGKALVAAAVAGSGRTLFVDNIVDKER
jgi:biotin transport system substrate-specific component